jgi:hypothetical protein
MRSIVKLVVVAFVVTLDHSLICGNNRLIDHFTMVTYVKVIISSGQTPKEHGRSFCYDKFLLLFAHNALKVENSYRSYSRFSPYFEPGMDVLFLEWNVMQLFDNAADFAGELHAAAEAGTRLLSQELPCLLLTISSP